MVEQMKTKILKNIDFDAVASLNVQEMNLLVGGEGGRYSKEDGIIAIIKKIFEEFEHEREHEHEHSNGNCGCTNSPPPQR